MSLDVAIKMFRENLQHIPNPTANRDALLWWNLSSGLLNIAEGIAGEVSQLEARLAGIEQTLAQLKQRDTR